MSFLGRNTRQLTIVLPATFLLISLRMAAQQAASSSETERPQAGSSLGFSSHTAIHGTKVETSISVDAVGQLTTTRISDSRSNYVTESLSPSAGAFGSFQQSFKPWLGYSVNFGYTRATYRYAAAPAVFGNAVARSYIPSNVYETSVSYVARKHLSAHLAFFGEAGGGAIAFAAITRSVSSRAGDVLTVQRSNTFRPTGIAGFGVDYRLEHGLSLRAAYRGLVFSFPDYASGRPGSPTLTSEPMMGLTYTFRKGGQH